MTETGPGDSDGVDWKNVMASFSRIQTAREAGASQEERDAMYKEEVQKFSGKDKEEFDTLARLALGKIIDPNASREDEDNGGERSAEEPVFAEGELNPLNSEEVRKKYTESHPKSGYIEGAGIPFWRFGDSAIVRERKRGTTDEWDYFVVEKGRGTVLPKRERKDGKNVVIKGEDGRIQKGVFHWEGDDGWLNQEEYEKRKPEAEVDEVVPDDEKEEVEVKTPTPEPVQPKIEGNGEIADMEATVSRLESMVGRVKATKEALKAEPPKTETAPQEKREKKKKVKPKREKDPEAEGYKPKPAVIIAPGAKGIYAKNEEESEFKQSEETGEWYVKRGKETRHATKEEIASRPHTFKLSPNQPMEDALSALYEGMEDKEKATQDAEDWNSVYQHIWQEFVGNLKNVKDVEKVMSAVTIELDRRRAEIDGPETLRPSKDPIVNHVRKIHPDDMPILEDALYARREQLFQNTEHPKKIDQDISGVPNIDLAKLEKDMEAAKKSSGGVSKPMTWKERLFGYKEKVIDIPRKGHIKFQAEAREWAGRIQNKWKKGTPEEKVFMALVAATGIIGIKTVLLWATKGNAQDVIQFMPTGNPNIKSIPVSEVLPYTPEISTVAPYTPDISTVPQYVPDIPTESPYTPEIAEIPQVAPDMETEIKDFAEQHPELMTPPETQGLSVFPDDLHPHPGDTNWDIMRTTYNRSDLTPKFATLHPGQKRFVLDFLTQELNAADLGVRSGNIHRIDAKDVLNFNNTVAGNPAHVNEVIERAKKLSPKTIASIMRGGK